MRNCWNWQTGSVEVAVFVRAYEFKSHIPHQIPFTLSVEAMSFTFIPRFNYPELSNNSLRLCRICRCGGMVDTYALGAYAIRRVGSSPIIGTKYARMLKLVDKSVSKTDAVKRVGPSPTLSTRASTSPLLLCLLVVLPFPSIHLKVININKWQNMVY